MVHMCLRIGRYEMHHHKCIQIDQMQNMGELSTEELLFL
jgi:hypothetical protein